MKMIKTIFKISFRNFLKHWRVTMLIILGSMIATILMVGGLSVNDSVSKFLRDKVLKNFGSIDIVAREKTDTIFLPKELDLEKSLPILENLKEVEKFVAVRLAQANIIVNGKYADIYVLEVTPEFEKFIGRKVNGTFISKDTAIGFGLKKGQTIEVVTAKGTFKVKVDDFGTDELNFRGETASQNGTLFLSSKEFERIGVYPLSGPNTFLITLKIPIEAHERFAKTLSSQTSLRVNPVKFRLFNSPLNRLVGYLFIGFSGFALISSFLFVSNFFGILAEERRKSLGVLKTIGFTKGKMFSVLFLEGIIYLISSGTIGAFLGIFFGKYLVYRINKFTFTGEVFVSLQENINFYITARTVLLGVFVSLIIPIMILLFRSRKFAKVPPYEVITGNIKEERKNYLRIIFVLIFLLLIFSFRYSYIYTVAIIFLTIPLFVNSHLINFVFGISAMLVLIPKFGVGSGTEFLLRALFILIGSVYVIFSFLPVLIELFKKIKNVPLMIAVAYTEKYKVRNFVIFLIYSVTLVLVLVSAIIPESVFRYVELKKGEGAYGFDFIIVENPIKFFFGSYKYLNDEKFKSYFDSLSPIQLVEGRFGNETKKYSFILANKDILENLKVPGLNTEELMKVKLDKFIILNNNLSVKDTPNITLKGILPAISGTYQDEFKVVATFDPEQALVPVDGIIVAEDKKIMGALRGYVGRVKDTESAIKAQEFVASKFDGAFYITAEIERIFSSLENLVNMSLQLFYLGFIAGFAGLAVITYRNVYVRKREIGMLRSVGTSQYGVMMIFVFESLALITVAMLTAILSTYFIVTDLTGYVAETLQDFKIIVPFWKTFITLVSVYFISLLFVIIPARSSLRVPPAEALRVFD